MIDKKILLRNVAMNKFKKKSSTLVNAEVFAHPYWSSGRASTRNCTISNPHTSALLPQTTFPRIQISTALWKLHKSGFMFAVKWKTDSIEPFFPFWWRRKWENNFIQSDLETITSFKLTGWYIRKFFIEPKRAIAINKFACKLVFPSLEWRDDAWIFRS